MSQIKFLDCTLRDGGYINQWKFGRERTFELGFDCHDILDSNNTWFTLIEENQVVSGFSSIYGTSFLVSFKCEF